VLLVEDIAMFRRWITFGSLGLFAVHFSCAGLAKADDKNWLGKDVIVKNNNVKVNFSDQNGARRQIASKNIVQKVRSEVDGWLEVGNDGEPGWFDKDDVVLIDDAPAYFTTLIQGNPNDHYAYAYRGVAWRYKGDFDNSIKDLTQAIRIAPNVAAWYNDRGLTYNNMKDFDRAIADYTEAIRLNPRWALLYNNRGLAYANKHEYGPAIAEYNQALQLDPKYALAYTNRGVALYEEKDYDRAIADYTSALRLDPKNAPAYNNRGNALRNQHEYERAVNDYNEATLLDGKYAAAYNNVAWLQAACPKDSVRDGRKAVENANRACVLTDWKNPGFIANLAAACAEDGQFADAVKWQKKALEDAGYRKQNGDEAGNRLKLYEHQKPYREN
jgi:Flp pilus assembly protein TadD